MQMEAVQPILDKLYGTLLGLKELHDDGPWGGRSLIFQTPGACHVGS